MHTRLSQSGKDGGSTDPESTSQLRRTESGTISLDESRYIEMCCASICSFLSARSARPRQGRC